MKVFWYALLMILPVVFLAALHTHPLWSSASLPASDAQNLSVPLTRITRAPAAIIETGMEMDDLINGMAFDPDGILWLSSLDGGVYLYSIRTNEVVHLLFPEYVFGLFPEPKGIWVLTSRAAFLYRNQIRVRTVIMPDDAKPLCGITSGENVFFGTTAGLYQAKPADLFASRSGLNTRINQIALHDNTILIAADDGIYLWKDGTIKQAGFSESNLKQRMFVSICIDEKAIVAATQQDGLILMLPDDFRKVVFAKRSLNIFNSASAIKYRGDVFFGTSSGYLVSYSKNRWKVYEVSESAITALAQNEESLYLWSGNKLLVFGHTDEHGAGFILPVLKRSAGFSRH